MGIPALRGNGRRLVQPRNPYSGATGEKNPLLSNNTRQGDYLLPLKLKNIRIG